MSIQVVDPVEIEAVKRGEIEGDVYRDGEVFAEEDSLAAWRERQGAPAQADAA